MKKSLVTFYLLMLASIGAVSAQDLPSPVLDGFAVPLGLKFTIKLYPADSGKFNASIIEAEEFVETIELFGDSTLFAEKGNDSTIAFYFCLATHGEGEKERNENMQVVLTMKNFTKYHLNYVSEIRREEEGEFEPTSNLGTVAGAVSTEMWPYMVYWIGLRDFRLMKEE